MSLITDTDYLIQSLRLSYLRRIPDPYGPRVISLDPQASSNDHVRAAGLTDPQRWPELAAAASSPPPVSATFPLSGGKASPANRLSGWGYKPGGGGSTSLRYTQTVVGPGRTGALGMRVHGKRAAGVEDVRSPGANTAPVPVASASNVATVQEVLGGQPQYLDPEASSDDEDDAGAGDDEAEYSDEKDESAIGALSRAREGSANASQGTISSLASPLSPTPGPRALPADPTLQPISFTPPSSSLSAPTFKAAAFLDDADLLDDADADAEPPADSREELASPDEDHVDSGPGPPSGGMVASTTAGQPDAAMASASKPPSSPTPSQNEWFSSLSSDPSTVASRHASRPQVSALTALMSKASTSPSNPFAEFYAGLAVPSSDPPSAGFKVLLYFPWSTTARQRGEPMEVRVRKDATAEEVIGHGLWSYSEEGWEPRVEDLGDEARLKTVGWTLRVVEDGEVDDDYPAVDRMLTLSKFGDNEFAICQATPIQIKQNEMTQANIRRRASRVMATGRKLLAPNAFAQANAGATSIAEGGGGGAAAAPRTMLGTPIIATGLSRSATASGPPIFLRVLVTPNPEVRYKTTINVPSDMYLADVLELICRKRQLGNVDEWALVVHVPDENKDVVVLLDRTIESLEGKHDLALVKRKAILGASAGAGALTGQSTNPNASIFKNTSEPSQPKYVTGTDFTAAYRKYAVNRKMPMFVGRHERVLTLDGDWVHIRSPEARAFHTKTSNFHINNVISCKQSRKTPNSFKLVVWRDGDTKRYDFEAENEKQAAEIIAYVQAVKRRHSREAAAGARRNAG